jgi:superfamily II DNA or RNA helicase
MSIPSGRVDLIPEYFDIVDKRIEVPQEFPEFKFKLRESQQVVYDQINSDAFINAWTSWGKTFTALAIAGKLKQKTLIIVHTIALRDQWAQEVKKVYGFEPSIIGSGKVDMSAPITIGNVQSLSKMPRQLLEKSFGTIMVDECHHIPSKTFSALIDTSHAKYKIGLSASNKRKDKLHILFSDYFSKKTFTPPRENYVTPTIHRVSVPIRLADGAQSWAEKVNDLCYSEDYQRYISLISASYAAKGHKVLTVAARTQLLERCQEITPDSVCIIGSTKDRQDKLKAGAKVLYGSINIFSEGISMNELSCLVMATPLNNEPLLEQLIGRVIRKAPGKLDPVIVDIQLIGKTVANQAQLRKAYYLKQGYNIVDI